MRYTEAMDGDLAAADYQRLLQLRTGLRRFLRWSAKQAERAGLTPAQHLLMAFIAYGRMILKPIS